MASSQARFDIMTDDAGRHILVVEGDWTVFTVNAVDRGLRDAHLKTPISAIDVSALGRIDTAGAYLMDRSLRGDDPEATPEQSLIGAHASVASLLRTARDAVVHDEGDEIHPPGWIMMLDRLGHGAESFLDEFLGLLSFVGEAFATIFRLMLRPHRIRWTSVFAVMEDTGLNALPIVSFLAFFIGLVIAFLGVNLLQQFGAQVFTVEMVGVLMLREMGVLLTAILLAGRTDSAFTAQIGAMKMREEVDALRVLGLDPMEVLVAPRLLALVVMTPFLTFAAMIAGILGGLLVMWATIDVSPAMFIQRIHSAVPSQHFWVGIVKAPVFAIVVGLIGCRQGLLVSGDVQTLGKRTTQSVVQAIFSVIVLDALFAVMYLEMDV